MGDARPLVRWLAVLILCGITACGPGNGSMPMRTPDEVIAIDRARGLARVQLAGEPARVASRRMTLEEFNARLHDRAGDCRGGSAPVTLVAITGSLRLPEGPGRSGWSAPVKGQMWLLLDAAGNVVNHGASPPGHELDLASSAPPPKPLQPCVGTPPTLPPRLGTP